MSTPNRGKIPLRTSVVLCLWGEHNVVLLSRKGGCLGIEDPAKPAVSQAVNCIWDSAHISFDLIYVPWYLRVEKGNQEENDYFTINAKHILLQLFTTKVLNKYISPKQV